MGGVLARGEQLRLLAGTTRRRRRLLRLRLPGPARLPRRSVAPAGARWDDALGEFVLPYELVRTAPDPDATLLAFLQSTYEAAARPQRGIEPRSNDRTGAPLPVVETCIHLAAVARSGAGCV